MDAGPRDGNRPDDDDGLPRPPASDRLQLEIALLAAAAPEPFDDGIGAGEPGRTVLLAVGDADLREYIKQCLRQRADLRVVEAQPGDDRLNVGQRQPVALVIADGSPDGAAALNGPPLLLVGDELSEALPVREGAGMAFLIQPFNARRLLDVVARLLGQASG
jgi:hypothetical protein